jgi:hypothetical protein
MESLRVGEPRLRIEADRLEDAGGEVTVLE